jgi:hypothetical protein
VFTKAIFTARVTESFHHRNNICSAHTVGVDSEYVDVVRALDGVGSVQSLLHESWADLFLSCSASDPASAMATGQLFCWAIMSFNFLSKEPALVQEPAAHTTVAFLACG